MSLKPATASRATPPQRGRHVERIVGQQTVLDQIEPCIMPVSRRHRCIVTCVPRRHQHPPSLTCDHESGDRFVRNSRSAGVKNAGWACVEISGQLVLNGAVPDHPQFP